MLIEVVFILIALNLNTLMLHRVAYTLNILMAQGGLEEKF